MAASEFVALSVLIWSIFSGAGAASSQSQADRIFGPCSYKRRSGALSLSVLMRFWRGEVMPVNEEEFVWPPVTFWLMKNRNGAKPLQQSLNTEHIFRIIISYFDETLQDELTLLRQGALSCPAPALPPSIRKKRRKEGIGGGSLWTWLCCRLCRRPTHWHNPRMASECAHSKFEFPHLPYFFLHIYCMYFLNCRFEKLQEK